MSDQTGYINGFTVRYIGPMQQNVRGEWIPDIPEPLYIGRRKNRCGCGAIFKGRDHYRRYREHCAYEHILHLEERDW